MITMKHGINYAYFECKGCGHRCTAPEAINAIPHEMERYGILRPDADVPKVREDIARKHRGNRIIIDSGQVRMERSYANVAFQSATILEESDHITLACPECAEILYDVSWKKRRRDMVR